MKKQFLIILLLSLGLIGISSAGEVETNILKLNALNSCESCNLQGADLTAADLSEADLTGADLSEADLSGANLIQANLRKANLSDADLSKAYLGGVTFCNTKLPWGIDDSGC